MGTRTRTRLVDPPECAADTETNVCAQQDACPDVDCEWGAWEEGVCVVDAAGAACERNDTRSHAIEAEMDGALCIGDDSRVVACASCSQDCEVTEWSAWSECDLATCLVTKTRNVTAIALGDGAVCPEELVATEACDASVTCDGAAFWTAGRIAGVAAGSVAAGGIVVVGVRVGAAPLAAWLPLGGGA